MGTASFNRRWYMAFDLFIALLLLCQGSARAWIVERVSLSSEGEETAGFYPSEYSSISHNGRFVSFSTQADNLVPNDTNDRRDIFVRDRKLGTTVRVNLGSDGSQITDYHTYRSKISGEGRFVVLDSQTSDLADAIPTKSNIYLHEMATGQTVLITTGHDGAPADDHAAWNSRVDISYDGRYIVFPSFATNLVAGDTNAKTDIFIYGRKNESISMVTRSHNGGLANDSSNDPAVSADGRYIVFSSRATNLVEGVTTSTDQIYRYDRESGATELVSARVDGTADKACGEPSISRDARLLAFRSSSTNLADEVPAGNTTAQIYLRDMNNGSITLVSKNADGEPGDRASSYYPIISPDGRYVLFNSQAKNLLPDNSSIASFYSTAFLYDHQQGSIDLVPSPDSGVVPVNACQSEDIADEGKFASFTSSASNLVPDDTNGWADVFVAIKTTEAWSISPTG